MPFIGKGVFYRGNKMAKKYFRSGEFARFCNTTKDTLFHYDDIGLLKPAKIAANGYRYYAANQMLLFDMISMLKEVGMSLHEIKEYIDKRDRNNFLTMLKEKDKQMRMEIERLKRFRRLLKNTIRITHNASYVEENKVEFMDKAEEYFIVTPVSKKDDEKSLFEAIAYHLDYCERYNIYDSFTFGEIIKKDDVKNGSFRTGFLCNRIDKYLKNKALLIKPAGLYAVKYVRCSYDDLVDEYRLLCEEIRKLGYQITGDIYEEDMLNYLSEHDYNDYLMKIEVQVKKQ